MAQGKIIRIGPTALTTTLTTNIFNIPFVSGTQVLTYAIFKHARIVNRSGSIATFSLWLGAPSGNVAGTEIIGQGFPIQANSYYDWFGIIRLENSTDFIVGGASANSALTLMLEGEAVTGN